MVEALLLDFFDAVEELFGVILKWRDDHLAISFKIGGGLKILNRGKDAEVVGFGDAIGGGRISHKAKGESPIGEKPGNGDLRGDRRTADFVAEPIHVEAPVGVLETGVDACIDGKLGLLSRVNESNHIGFLEFPRAGKDAGTIFRKRPEGLNDFVTIGEGQVDISTAASLTPGADIEFEFIRPANGQACEGEVLRCSRIGSISGKGEAAQHLDDVAVGNPGQCRVPVPVLNGSEGVLVEITSGPEEVGGLNRGSEDFKSDSINNGRSTSADGMSVFFGGIDAGAFGDGKWSNGDPGANRGEEIGGEKGITSIGNFPGIPCTVLICVAKCWVCAGVGLVDKRSAVGFNEIGQAVAVGVPGGRAGDRPWSGW